MKNFHKISYFKVLLILLLVLNVNIKPAHSDGQYVAGSITINWTNNDLTSTNFTMINSAYMKPGSYFAFAFSTDKMMGNDDVAVCQVNPDGSVSLYHYRNIFKGISCPLSSSNPSIGFSNILTRYSSGTAQCSFTRQNALTSVTNYFISNSAYYVLTASGSVYYNFFSFFSSSALKYSISYHGKSRSSSANLINFSAYSSNQSTTTMMPSPNGILKGNYVSSIASLSWTGNSNSTNFSMTTSNINSGNYFAFGLSYDQLMGNDDVAVCQVNSNGAVSVNHYYNGAKGVSLLLSSSNPTVGFSNIVTSIKNGVATCNFTRANSLPTVTNYFNQNSQYYLLSATGPLNSNGAIRFHVNQEASTSMISFKLS